VVLPRELISDVAFTFETLKSLNYLHIRNFDFVVFTPEIFFGNKNPLFEELGVDSELNYIVNNIKGNDMGRRWW